MKASNLFYHLLNLFGVLFLFVLLYIVFKSVATLKFNKFIIEYNLFVTVVNKIAAICINNSTQSMVIVDRDINRGKWYFISRNKD